MTPACARLFVSTAAATLMLLAAPPAHAQGLIGDFFEAVGRTTGIKPIEDLGRNADAEHKRFKDANPVYKVVEENGSRAVSDTSAALFRPVFSLVCTQTFEAVIGVVRGGCGGFNAQSFAGADRAIIQSAVQRLVGAGLVAPAEFNGVAISWCAGSFEGAGIAPGPGEIMLHEKIKDAPLDDIASTLAHEMHHIRQYRAMGSGSFKCAYAQDYIGCGGCQDERHPLEREAYQFEAYAIRRLGETSAVPRTTEASFTPRQRLLSSAVTTNVFLTEVPKPVVPTRVIGSGDPDPQGIAKDACTLNGRVPSDGAEQCADDMTVIYDDLLETVDDDFATGFEQSVDTYLRVTRADRAAACTILQATHRNPEIGRIRKGSCETRSRTGVYNVIRYALRKYPTRRP